MEHGFFLGSMFYVLEFALYYGGLVQLTSHSLLSLLYGLTQCGLCSSWRTPRQSSRFPSSLSFLWSLLQLSIGAHGLFGVFSSLGWWLCLRLLMLALGSVFLPHPVGILPDAHLCPQRNYHGYDVRRPFRAPDLALRATSSLYTLLKRFKKLCSIQN